LSTLRRSVPVAGARPRRKVACLHDESETNARNGCAHHTILSWTAGSGADSHDVYFGTNPNPGPSEFQGNQADTTFDPGYLGKNTWYYWRIDEVNAHGTTIGVVWSFKSASK